jgi:hypothetical protein
LDVSLTQIGLMKGILLSFAFSPHYLGVAVTPVSTCRSLRAVRGTSWPVKLANVASKRNPLLSSWVHIYDPLLFHFIFQVLAMILHVFVNTSVLSVTDSSVFLKCFLALVCVRIGAELPSLKLAKKLSCTLSLHEF